MALEVQELPFYKYMNIEVGNLKRVGHSRLSWKKERKRKEEREKEHTIRIGKKS